MKIIHISNGWEKNNGAAEIARHIAAEQARNEGANVHCSRFPRLREIRSASAVWVHCGWMPCLWRAVVLARLCHVPVIKWMPEACYDPVRLNYHGWKKWLVGPIERFCLRRTTSLVATCAAEAEWIKDYVGPKCPSVEVIDIKKYFDLSNSKTMPSLSQNSNNLHVLYLGRRHPLKGIEFLEQAVKELNQMNPGKYSLRLVSNHTGDELEADWAWCDVLCLPTLSDNFGLVIAEALARGKRVITTDGAPAWSDLTSAQGIYLKNYRNGTNDQRVRLLVEALSKIMAV